MVGTTVGIPSRTGTSHQRGGRLGIGLSVAKSATSNGSPDGRCRAGSDLRTRIMQTANIRSAHFAETLMQEARDSGLLQTILINSRREYMFHNQQQLFDEDT